MERMGMRRFVSVLGVAGIGIVAACTSFSTDGGDVADAGDEAARADGESPGDAAPAADGDATPLEASTDAGACTSFESPAAGGGWNPDLVGGGVLAATSYQGRSCVEAAVTGAGQHAAFYRSLVVPKSTRFTVRADLQVAKADGGASVGWTVDVVSIVCQTPASKLTFELVPDGTLMAEMVPPPAAVQAVQFGTPPPTWEKLVIEVDGTRVTASFNGLKQVFQTAAGAGYQNAGGCQVTVGAVANMNVAPTSVHLASACLELF